MPGNNKGLRIYKLICKTKAALVCSGDVQISLLDDDKKRVRFEKIDSTVDDILRRVWHCVALFQFNRKSSSYS